MRSSSPFVGSTSPRGTIPVSPLGVSSAVNPMGSRVVGTTVKEGEPIKGTNSKTQAKAGLPTSLTKRKSHSTKKDSMCKEFLKSKKLSTTKKEQWSRKYQEKWSPPIIMQSRTSNNTIKRLFPRKR